MATRAPLEQRFWSKVDKRGPDECWPWRGGLNQKGYGRIRADGRPRPVQQIAWELANEAPFPSGAHGCHSCDNPSCVNPAHVWPGTNLDNIRDCQAKGRWRFAGVPSTHCVHGHEYTPENTGHRWTGARAGQRVCLTCTRDANRKKQARRRAAFVTVVDTARALLEASERHIFGDECLAEREALRAALQTIGDKSA